MPLGDRAAAQMHLPGRVRRPHRPGDAQNFGHTRVRTARRKTAGECRAGIKSVSLMEKSAGASSGIGLFFENCDAQACIKQQCSGRQAAYTCANNNDVRAR